MANGKLYITRSSTTCSVTTKGGGMELAMAGGRGDRGCADRFKREGTYIYLWLIYVVVWQKSTQYCKAIILQLKINFKKRQN